MQRALVVAEDSTAGRRLLEEAADLAGGVGAELVVLAVVDEAEYTGSLERKTQSGHSDDIASIDDVTEAARTVATELAEDVIDAVDYTPLGSVGRLPTTILETADEYDCDHVFIVGRRRSPAGKVVFGDTAQSVILNFDGPVTVITDDG